MLLSKIFPGLVRDVRMLILRAMNAFDRALLMDAGGMGVTYPEIPLEVCYMRGAMLVAVPPRLIRRPDLVQYVLERNMHYALEALLSRIRREDVDLLGFVLYAIEKNMHVCAHLLMRHDGADYVIYLWHAIYRGTDDMCESVYNLIPGDIRKHIHNRYPVVVQRVPIANLRWCMVTGVFRASRNMILSIRDKCSPECVQYMNIAWAKRIRKLKI